MREEPAGRLWVDATFGVAGDMLLAALIDAGARLDVVQAAVDAVLPATVRLSVSETSRRGLRAAYLTVELVREDSPHRDWSVIRGLLLEASLPRRVTSRAMRTFEVLAEAEGRVHGVPVSEVEFHEVGSWDSIADVVGVCAALEDLGIGTLVHSPIALGSGTVRGAHGLMPVPVPAVVELLRGTAIQSGAGLPGVAGELATPTGVALLVGLGSGEGTIGGTAVGRAGVGAGTREFDSHPNIVRVVLSASVASSLGDDVGGLVHERLTQLDTNVDDLDPRVWPSVLSALMEAGARDAWLTPILMKKGRPAHTLSVLSDDERVWALRELIFRLTSTIGTRETSVARRSLPRAVETVRLRAGMVRVKVAHRDGVVLNVSAEYDDVAALAEAIGMPVRQLLDEALTAAASAGLTLGAPYPVG